MLWGSDTIIGLDGPRVALSYILKCEWAGGGGTQVPGGPRVVVYFTTQPPTVSYESAVGRGEGRGHAVLGWRLKPSNSRLL